MCAERLAHFGGDGGETGDQELVFDGGSGLSGGGAGRMVEDEAAGCVDAGGSSMGG